MRKNYIYFIVLFILSISVSAQKVTLTPATVNNIGYTGGPINLGGVAYSSVSLSVKVELPDNVAVGDTGTIKIYCSNGTALGVNVAVGGDGGSLYFGGGKVATRSFYINLSWSDFSTSFAYLFAEYKNPAGASYKSSNISIIKNSTLNGGTVNAPADAPNPNKITNTICCDQTIRQGDKPAPITGSLYNNPYFDKIYGINNTWSAYALLDFDNANQIVYLDYYNTPLTSQTIQRKLGYNGTSDFPNKSNVVTITIVPSPITLNEISVNSPANSDGYIEIINTNPKQIYGTRPSANVNLNILQNPFHTPQRGDNLTQIEKFEWEYRKIGSVSADWIKINNSHPYDLESFNPTDLTDGEDNFYLVRRIAFYQNIKKVSNTLKLLLRTIRHNNTICCDQTLVISSSNTIDSPNLIIGAEATPDPKQSTRYQWQSQSIDNNTSAIGNWTNIAGATSKDFLPPSLQLVSSYDPRNPRETTWKAPMSYNYRRLTVPSYHNGQSSYSNEITLTSISYKEIPLITAYPNPATSIINIENKGNLLNMATTSVTIVNVTGTIVNSNNYSIISPSIISIDVSSLPSGTYFINLDTGDRRSTKITFLKNN